MLFQLKDLFYAFMQNVMKSKIQGFYVRIQHRGAMGKFLKSFHIHTHTHIHTEYYKNICIIYVHDGIGLYNK